MLPSIPTPEQITKNKFARPTPALLLAAALLVSAPTLSFAATDTYAKTRYPIVTATGFTGAPKMVGIVDYWYGLENALKARGNSHFYVPLLSSLATENIRVKQMEAAIQRILAETGTDKVNLIGHSQGGYTVRAYAALHPEQVASVTTIGGNHRGSRMADLVWELNGKVASVAPELRDAIVWIVEKVMWLNGVLNGADLEQEALPTLYMSTTQGSLEFAENVSDFAFNPDCNGPMDTRATGTYVDAAGETRPYDFPVYSWVGSGAPTSLFKSGQNLLDPSGVGMSLSYKVLKNWLAGGPNDGVVTTCSAALGEVISTSYYWDHLDEVNQLFGLTPKPDPRTVIVAHANRLAQQGL